MEKKKRNLLSFASENIFTYCVYTTVWPVWLFILFCSKIIYEQSDALFVQQVVCVNDAQWYKYDIAINTVKMFSS